MVALVEVKNLSRNEALVTGDGVVDLPLPAGEQTKPLALGDKILCFIDEDDEGPFASMRLEDFLEYAGGEFTDGQEVDLVIAAKTDLGFKAVVDGTHWGILYRDEVYQPLDYGQRIKGYVKKVREDRKLDLILQNPTRPGARAAAEDIGPKILEKLKSAGGFLPINDKTPPEEIYDSFGVSKKKFKIALGDLYKRRLIFVSEEGIRVTAPSEIRAAKRAMKPQRPRK